MNGSYRGELEGSPKTLKRQKMYVRKGDKILNHNKWKRTKGWEVEMITERRVL